MTGVCGTATRFPAATLFVDRGADCDRLGAPLRASAWLDGTWKLAVDVPPESKLAPRLRAIAPASNNETCACDTWPFALGSIAICLKASDGRDGAASRRRRIWAERIP